ncbi:MAG: hypothetical protein JSS32_01600 [Verrucomicrobia bacterium]|nr:hypothetical protein [Verrucomicrobiota bacterium]
MDKESRAEILKETFQKTEAESIASTPKPVSEKTSLPLKSTIPDPAESISYSLFFPPPPMLDDHLLVSNIETIRTFNLPNEAPLDLLSHLPKDLIVPTLRHQSSTPRLPNFHPEKPLALQTISPKIEMKSSVPKIAYNEPSIVVPDLAEPPTKTAVLRPSLVGSLPQLPTLEELETSSYSEDFETDLVFLPREDGEGYIFALTLIPHADLNLPKIRQHYMFLIDRSNSIQRERLQTTKNSVMKALEEIELDDTFNIIAFDSKMEKLSPSQLTLTPQSLAKAEDFIKKIELGSFFSPSDLYRPLLMTVPSQVQEDEIYTAILLTDGESLVKKSNQKAILQQWTAYNQGKVSLQIVAMDGDKNLPTLDTASAFNRGKVISSNTKRGFKRKVLKVMKNIHTPIAKNLSCRAFSHSSNVKIELYPKSNQTSHLYQGHPYVLIGTTTNLDDFILFVQGRLKDRWLNIKKKITFVSAKKGDSSLKSEWALQKAYGLYEQYLQDNRSEHLAEAKALLEPLQLQAALQ